MRLYEAVEKKQIIKIRTNQSDCECLTPARDPAGPAQLIPGTGSPWVLVCAGQGRHLTPGRVLLRNLARPETGHWPGLRGDSWHLSQWPGSWVSGVRDIRHQGQARDNCQESVNRSSYVKLVHNWPGREGRSREKCWDPAQFKDVTKLCSGVLSTKYPRRAIVDWLNLDIWQRFMEARPYNWLNFMELGFQVMGVNLILASSRR